MLVILVTGVVIGAVYALIGLGLVLEYRFSRVMNLAYGGQALLAAYIANYLRGHVGIALAIIAGTLASSALGVALEYLSVERIPGATELVRMIVTLGALLVLLGVSGELFGQSIYFTPTLFSARTVKVLGVFLTVDELILMAITAVLIVGTVALLRYTNLGVRVRAAGERPVLAEALGINSRALGRIVWAVGGALAGIGGILLTPLVNLDPTTYVLLVIAAYAGVLVGGMENVGLTAVGCLVLGLLQQLSTYWFRTLGIQQITTLFMVLIVLVVQGKKLAYTTAEEVV